MANLFVNYVNIGQGDCTLIVDPGGTRIMIDYGSHHGALGNDCITLQEAKNAADDEVKQLQRLKPKNRSLTYAKDLKNALVAQTKARSAYKDQKDSDNRVTDMGVADALATFLGKKKKIDYLILTHHDGDHYNKVPLLKLLDITLGKLYYSGPITKYNVLRANYPAPALVDEYISITINGKTQANQTMIESDGDVTILCQTGKKTIYTKAAGGGNPKYSVDILASNVHANPADQGVGVKTFHFGPEDINGRSIVTLITYGTDKILIMGDATTATEDFLVTTYGAALQSDTLRVGHHGSDSSSSQDFIDEVEAEIAIISCSIMNSYDLPTTNVTGRYTTDFAARSLTAVKHDLVAYRDNTYPVRYTTASITRPLWQTWSLGTTNVGYSGT